MPQKPPVHRSSIKALAPEARARRRAVARRRRQFLVGALFAGVAVSGMLAWQRLSQAPDPARSQAPGLFQGTTRAHGQDATLNGAVLENAVAVQSALEAYRQQHGRIPATAEEFNREVLPRFPQGSLPRSPWGGTQAGMLGLTPELARAVAAADDERWVVGPARKARTIERPTDLGALVYEASGGTYQIYGIGRGADGRAMVLVRLTSP